MKLIISKENLIKGTTTVSKAVPAKTAMEILTCVLLSAKDNELSLYANDMEMAITTKVDCFVEEEGTLAVNAEMLCEMARRLPDGDITLMQDDSQLIISAPDITLTLPTMDHSVFPPMLGVSDGKIITIPQNTLKSMITQSIFARAETEKNEIFRGLNLKVKDKKAYITGLDQKRIAIRSCDITSDIEENTILPGKTMNEIRKILSDDDTDVTISITQALVMFAFDKTVVVSRVVDGTYMDIDRIINTRNPVTKASMDKTALLSCLDRSLLLEKTENMAPVIFKMENRRLNISLKTSRGVLDENTPAIVMGEDILIGFDPRVFIDVLKIYGDDEVTLEFCGNSKPCFICSKDNDFIYIAMPIAIRN